MFRNILHKSYSAQNVSGSSEVFNISRFKNQPSATKVLKRVYPFQSLTIFNKNTLQIRRLRPPCQNIY